MMITTTQANMNILSYVYTYTRSRDGHATIVGRAIYTGHKARNGLSGHASLQPPLEAGSRA